MGLRDALNLDGGGLHWLDGRWGDDRVGPWSLRLDSQWSWSGATGFRRRLFPYTLSEAAMPKGLTVHLSAAAAAELGRQAAVAGTPGLMHLDLVEGGCERGC